MDAAMTAVQEIEFFLNSWPGDAQPMRDWFGRFYRELASIEGVTFSFAARPGVSYSMRPVHNNQKEKNLFAIVDVIDDDPGDRWLSVCFYEDMITDPVGRGEVIPGGLSGQDGYCFDMYKNDEELGAYLLGRLQEAAAAAAGD